jgi:hypothetical protein
VSQVMVEWQGKGPEEATYDVNMKMWANFTIMGSPQ